MKCTLYSQSLEDSEMWIHTVNILTAHGFKNLGQLNKKTDAELLALPKIGKKHLANIREAIEGGKDIVKYVREVQGLVDELWTSY